VLFQHTNLTKDLAVGLSHIQTNWFPNIAVTNKELDIRGITRYTPGTFQSAIDLLARKVVDVKQLITAEYPLSRSQDAFEAVAARNDIKVLVRNQQM
jgi:D-xylulose reductase